MSIRARMPECYTSIMLRSSIPSLVRLDNGSVLFVGDDLWNRTLEVGDSLNSSDYITHVGVNVDFLFGDIVTVPGNNTILSNEQDFEISLQSTVLNNPKLVHNSRLKYSAFVETDFGIKTSTKILTITIAEPKLLINPVRDPNKYDAGDTVRVVIAVDHDGSLNSRLTDAFRVVLKVSYPTQNLELNTCSPAIHVGGRVYSSGSVEYDTIAGTVTYNVSELVKTDQMRVSLDYVLLNNVHSMQTISLSLDLSWDSLPYGMTGGRQYTSSGSHSIVIKSSKLHIAYSSTNPDTVGSVLQVHEAILLNITITPPEGMATILLRITSSQPERTCPLNFTSGAVLYIGAAIDTVLTHGESSRTSNRISVLDIDTVQFDIGAVNNTFDNVEDERDNIVLQVVGYISNIDCSNEAATITVTATIAKESGVSKSTSLHLLHPSLLVYFKGSNPSPVDGADVITLTIGLRHQVLLTSAYDISMNISLLSPFGPVPIRFLAVSSSCLATSHCSNSTQYIYCLIDKIVAGCSLTITTTTTLPNNLFADHYFTVKATLDQYGSSPADLSLEGRQYGPAFSIMRITSATPLQSISATRQLSYVPLPHVAPAEALVFQYMLTLPEGITLNLSMLVGATAVCGYCSPLVLNLTREAVGSNVNATVSIELNELRIFGDTLNTPDNVRSSADAILLYFELTVPNNTTETELAVFIDDGYTAADGHKIHKLVSNLIIVRPQLRAYIVSPSRIFDLGSNVVLTVIFNISSPTPAFHVAINTTVPHPLLEVRSVPGSTGTTITGSRSFLHATETTLSLTSDRIYDKETVQNEVHGYISHSAVGGQSITLMARMFYTSLPGEGDQSGEEYSDIVALPPIFISSLAMSVSLVSTTDPATDSNLLTFNEAANFNALLTGLIGPISELTVTISHDNADLIKIVGITVRYEGYQREYIGTHLVTQVTSLQHKISFTGTNRETPLPACSPMVNNKTNTHNCSIVVTVAAVAINKATPRRQVAVSIEAKHGVRILQSAFEMEVVSPVLSFEMSGNVTVFDKGDFISLSFQFTTQNFGAYLVRANILMPCKCRDSPATSLSCDHPISRITFTDNIMTIEFDSMANNEIVKCNFVTEADFYILLGQAANFTGWMSYSSLSTAARRVSQEYPGLLSTDSVVHNMTVVSPPPPGVFGVAAAVKTSAGDFYVASGSIVAVHFNFTIQEVDTDLQLILTFANTSTIPVPNKFVNFSTGKDIVLLEHHVLNLTDHIVCDRSQWNCVIDFGSVKNEGKDKAESLISFTFFLQLSGLQVGTVGRIEAVSNYTNASGTDMLFLNSVNLLVRDPRLNIANFTHNVTEAADSGDIVEMTFTVIPANGSVVSALQPTFLLAELLNSLELVGDLSAVLSGEPLALSDSSVLATGGLVTPDLHPSGNLLVQFQIQLQDNVRLMSQMRLNITLRYGEGGKLFTSALSTPPILTPSLSPPTLCIINSSLSTTNDRLLGIEEVFVLAAELLLFEASMSILLSLEFTSDVEKLPMKILDTELVLPVQAKLLELHQNTTNSTLSSTNSLHIDTSIVVPGTCDVTVHMLQWRVTAVTPHDAVNGSVIIARLSVSTDQTNVGKVTHNMTVSAPLLSVVQNQQLLDTGNPQLVLVNITVSHSTASKFPAFAVTLEKEMSPLLLLRESTLTSNAVVAVTSTNTGTTLLRVYQPILPLSFSLVLTLKIQAAKNATPLVPLSHSLSVEYFSILPENGLATLFPSYTGKRYTHHHTSSCVLKQDKPVMSVVTVVLWLVAYIIGILIGLVLVIVCCVLYKLCHRINTVVPVPVVIKRPEEEDYHIFDDWWYPCSPLLMSVSEYRWRRRTNKYEALVQRYTWLMEEDLYLLHVRTMVRVAVSILSESKLLSNKGRAQLMEELQHNVSEIRSSLRDSWKRELDQLMKTSCHDPHTSVFAAQLGSISQLLVDAHVPVSEVKAQVLRDVNTYIGYEEDDAQCNGEVEVKAKVLELRMKLMSHYYLWVKASIISILQLPCFSTESSLVERFEDVIGEAEEALAHTHTMLESMIMERWEREKRTLLHKQMLEEDDMILQQWIVKQLDGALAADLIRPLSDDIYTAVVRLKQQLSAAMEQLRTRLEENERQVIELGTRQLKERVTTGMVAMDTGEWTAIIEVVENTIKTVEDKAIQKLMVMWKGHQSDREEVLRHTTLCFMEQLVSISSVDLPSEREKIKEILEKSHILASARLQAHIDCMREKKKERETRLVVLHASRRGRERAFLSKILSAECEEEKLEIMETDFKQANLNLLSGSFSNLVAHINATRNAARKRCSKLKVVWKKWRLQHKKLTDARSGDEVDSRELWNVLCYLNKCEVMCWQSETSVYAEGIRRHQQDGDYQQKLEPLSTASVDHSSSSDVNSRCLLPSITPLLLPPIPTVPGAATTTGPLVNPVLSQSVPDDHRNLIDNHKQVLGEISARLEEDKTKARRDLEIKIRQKKFFKNKTTSSKQLLSCDEVATPTENFLQFPGKLARFRHIVMRVIYDMREEKFRVQQDRLLQNQVAQLERQYNMKKVKAFEKLDRNFESNLAQLGRLSEEQLVLVLRDIDSWKQSCGVQMSSESPLSERGVQQGQNYLPQLRKRRGTL